MKKGFALILLIFLLVACSLVAVVAFSLLAQGTTGGQGLAESMQAYAIAIGGKEWYLQQLAGDSDWTDETDQTDIALGVGSFDIAVNSPSANRASFTVTGFAPGYLDQTVQRQISLAAIKLPKACRFALFWQEDGPGTRLTLDKRAGGTHIVGDFWSVGSTRVDSSCSVIDGKVYYGAGESIDGRGTYTSCAVQEPFPDMPAIDTSGYENLMDQYDIDIANNPSTDTDYQSGTITLNGNTLPFQDFRTCDNLTITGYGKIVANRDVLLHYDGGGKGTQTLTITPDPGKTIEILAGRNFRINNTAGKRRVNISPNTIMYAGNSDIDSLFQIVQPSSSFYTSISEASILARRRLIVSDGASITDNSILYVDYASSNTNNLLQITDSGTTVSGKVISRGRDHPSLKINGGASVTGLVYQYGSQTRGRAQIDGGSTIDGALLVRQFHDDSLGPAAITHDLSAVLSLFPQGLDGYVMSEPNSWDDN